MRLDDGPRSPPAASQVDFSLMTFIDGGCLLVTDVSGVRDLTTLAGKKVAVVPGRRRRRRSRRARQAIHQGDRRARQEYTNGDARPQILSVPARQSHHRRLTASDEPS